MSKRLAGIVFFIFAGWMAGSRLQADVTKIEKVATEVAQNVKDLADPQKVDVAEIRLLAGGVNEYPAIEAAAGHPGLPPDVATKLKKIVATMRPMQPARLKVAAAHAKMTDWLQKTWLAAYDATGQKNPKWDAAAKTAISSYADDFGTSAETRDVAIRAIQLGCTDPFVLDIAGDCHDMAPIPDYDAGYEAFKASSAGIQSSSYPPDVKFLADIAYAYHLSHFGQSYQSAHGLPPPPPDAGVARPLIMSSETMGLSASLMHKAAAIWPRVVKEQNIPPAFLAKLADRFIDASFFPRVDRKKAFDQLFPALSTAFPNDAAVLSFEGQLYIDWAWDARGGAVASQVPKEKFDLFFDRLSTAEDCLTKAWHNDPDCSEAAAAMVTCALGRQEDRATINEWFKRAIKTNPDNVQAYRAKLMAIMPQWGGTAKDLADWQKDCIVSFNWHARLPLVATEVYDRISLTRVSDGPTTWQAPQTWKVINLVYPAWLNAYPEDVAARSRFTYLCCRCGQWAEAKKQFAALGDKAVDSEFGGSEMTVHYRQQILLH